MSLPQLRSRLCVGIAILGIAFPTASVFSQPTEETPEGVPSETVQSDVIVIIGKRQTGTADLQGQHSEHMDASSGLEQSTFVTQVRIDESEGEKRTVSEVLARTVGVTARSMGGLGAHSSISVRGADPGHTSVSVDGVPLSRIASVSANLGQFELGSFESIQLYRGGVPPHLGGAGVGGAVDMRTALGPGADGKRFLLSTGSGSYGAKHLRARWLTGNRGGKRAGHLSFGFSGATGDFSFFDDRATILNQADDRISVRQNNYFNRLDLLGRFRWGQWTVGSRSSLQNQGLPGVGYNQAEVAELSTFHELLDGNYQSDRLHARGFFSVERQHFYDPNDEIGLLAQDSVYLTTSAGLAGGTQYYTLRNQFSADLSTCLDWFREGATGGSNGTPSRGNRQSAALALSNQYEVFPETLFLDVGARGEVLRTRPSRDTLSPESTPPPRSEWYISPRLSLRWRVTSSVAFKGSVGRYLRLPTLSEMFGDRGVILGNAELVPEEGWSADYGVVWAPPKAMGEVDRVYFEATLFTSHPQNHIIFASRNGLAVQAVNLDDARILGSELVASLRIAKHVTVTGNYSYLDARNRGPTVTNNKVLPHRPKHRLYGRVDAAFSPRGHLLVLWTDLLHLSGNYVDELNIYELPDRQLLGGGIKVAILDDLLLGIEVKNAANLRREYVRLDPAPSPDHQRVPKVLSDVHGFPLPGRSLYLNLQWSGF